MCNGFNEARANCAGNLRKLGCATGVRPSFNEARANCAGNYLTRKTSSKETTMLQ